VIRYHDDNVITVEAFKRSYARVRPGRFDPREHRRKAIRARMKVNLIGRETKQRVRTRHAESLRVIPPAHMMREPLTKRLMRAS
jgi:hypothetical protein